MLKPTHKEKGSTTSERYLSHLCEKCFFGLWSYPNLYTDEGNKGGNTTGKELCDLLVVFGNDIIIFSDKMIEYKATENVNVGWTRWYKSAIKQSSSQIYGAERWIKEYPDRIYHDKFCKNKFILDIPRSSFAQIHRVIITSNMSKTCSEFYGGGSSGTFILTPTLEGDQHFAFPFQVGNVNPNKGYVHVFNELSISIVLAELDTVGDFLDYLKKREVLMLSGNVCSIAGEEELLGYYLGNHFDCHSEISTAIGNCNLASEYSISLSENSWSQYLFSVEYNHTKQSRKQSYVWDQLISNFDKAILSGTVPEWTDKHISNHEKVLRLLARERRAYRQILGRNLLEKITAVKANERSARILPSALYPDSYFVFLIYGREYGEHNHSYREERFSYLKAYCYVVKLLYPEIRYAVGVATEQMVAFQHSEDVIVYDFLEWSESDNIQAKHAQQELNILRDMNDKNMKEILLSDIHPWTKLTTNSKKVKMRRNDPCNCGSGKKYKKCCGF